MSDVMSIGFSEKDPERIVRANAARASSGRRRGVDPTTTDRVYSKAESEFIMAMDAYRTTSGRPFPTWSEALEVLVGLGYTRAAAPMPGGHA